MTRADSLTAIVVSYYTGNVLWDCLAALDVAVLNAAPTGEIIVVDNGNPADVQRALEAWASGAAPTGPSRTLITGHGNVGFARACNMAGARAHADHAQENTLFAFINPDAVVEPDALAILCATGLATGAQPWLVGGRLLGFDGVEQRGARRDQLTKWRAIKAATRLDRLEALHPVFRSMHRERDPVPDGPISVGAVSGAFFVMPAAEFAALGGFDEAYFLHVEDLDLCRRVGEAGGSVIFAPSARAHHVGGSSDAPSARIARYKSQGLATYFKKNASGPLDFVISVCLGFVVVSVTLCAVGLASLLRHLRAKP